MKNETETTEPGTQLVEVFKSLADAGRHTSPDLVRKSVEEMSLAEFGETMVQLMMREVQQQDPFLTKPEARADVYRSPSGGFFASLDRLPYAHEPVAKAISSIEGMGRGQGGWAQDVLNRLTAIDRGWV